MAGYRELLAVEWEQNAADTFRLNFPHVSLYHGDIASLSVDECLKRAGVAPGELDVFDGSPPCQGFSTAGKREVDDPRNQLFREYCRLLSGLRPRAFVMENVSGMVKGGHKAIFAEVLRTLKSCGYKVKARLLNAMFYGVPQSRERLIFVGVRDDIGVEPSHPQGWSVPVIVRDAFVRVSAPDSPALTPRYREYWNSAPQGGSVGKLRSVRKLSENHVPGTLLKSEGNGAPYHYAECRAISTAERKRIGSFPDAFVFTDFHSATARIGNSVPPLLMRAVASHVRSLIGR
jgi:DNA (cytosine-5)-methyltransferase 1